MLLVVSPLLAIFHLTDVSNTLFVCPYLQCVGNQSKAQHVAQSKKAAVVNKDVPTSVCLDVQNSYLPNRTPRFEEYTSDGDIATNENAAVSNDDRERDEAICNEVDNVEIDLTVDRALTERDDGDIDVNASLVLTMVTNDGSDKEADNAPSTSTCQRRLLGCSYFPLYYKYFIFLMNLIAFVFPLI
jgi:hypothetical protein